VTVTVLGISAFYHDAAAALVRDGEIIAAAQEERFSRKRHDPAFPKQAINFCLGEAWAEPSELDAVVFYDRPELTFDRTIRSLVHATPGDARRWDAVLGPLLGARARVFEHAVRDLGSREIRLLFAEHHFSHAASAFYPSPFEQAAVLVVDGVGEWSTCSIGFGCGNDLQILKEIRYPHSLGLLYSAFTYHCGFRVNSGEYKLMGLAPFGTPRYRRAILDNLIDLRDDGSFRLDMAYFGFLEDDRMTAPAFDRLFDGPARAPESPLTQREVDLAASVQAVLEEALVRLGSHARRLTGSRRLAMAGGVALNCVANARIARECGVQELWVQPAAGDAGGALGAALLASHQGFGVKRPQGRGNVRDRQKGSFLGPRFSSEEVRAFLEREELPHVRIGNPDERAMLVASAIAEGAIVGHFSGRMEFGPRALGARSILADPRRAEMQDHLNRAVKQRETFRPFAPAVLLEEAPRYFAMEHESPYMLVVAPVRTDGPPANAQPRAEPAEPLGPGHVRLPAITHVDGTARVQTVGPEDHAGLRRTLEAFRDLTGCPVLVNTSFNVRGEPIVCTLRDAYGCFMRTGIDLLVLEDCLLWKKDQPPLPEEEMDVTYAPD
jgi:carbamoyltransferase